MSASAVTPATLGNKPGRFGHVDFASRPSRCAVGCPVSSTGANLAAIANSRGLWNIGTRLLLPARAIPRAGFRHAVLAGSVVWAALAFPVVIGWMKDEAKK
ncbi:MULTISPECIES: hypothetical protein [Sphingobium]|uniref:Uncharacterized protein n=2 Tax=Sphingobium TaxID=165695 RepID=A0A6M4G0W3_SPHYA|nr:MULTISPECIES: hypothetical protein [Sphingobium]MBB4150859.1 hypothetical protein [Sphingobium scionense]QJR00709.1 hypothetical protein HH800_08155 [Sphingobium yanoikuyae]